MKLLIETSLTDFFIALVDNDVVDYIHIVSLKKKADALPIEVDNLLTRNKLSVRDIKDFYITTGPGSFMGSRNALVYARTICQITNANLYVSNTIDFISKGEETPVFIDAKGGQSYSKVDGKLTLVDFKEDTIINYKEVVSNINQYLQVFILADDILNLNPTYVKSPQIGGK